MTREKSSPEVVSAEGTPPVGVVRLTIGMAFLLTLLLQLWRFPFFLTDDTLSGWMPLMVESFRKLYHGGNPLISDSLFCGSFNLMGDPTSTCLFSPWAWMFSWLALTPYYWLLADVVSTLDVVTNAAVFAWAGLRLRTLLQLEISNRMMVALALSYAFSPFVFVVAPSWICFVHPQAAYPALFVAMLHPSTRRGIGIAAAAFAYAILGGHLHPVVMLLLICGVATLAIAFARRSWRPIIVMAGGGVVALIAFVPALLPMLQGFAETKRSHGVSAEMAGALNVPTLNLVASWFLGSASAPFVTGVSLHFSSHPYTTAIAFSLINIPLALILVRKRKWSPAEIALSIGVVVVGLCIVRPDWLGEIFVRLPLLKSLRWPFREIAALSFLTHLLFLLVLRTDHSADKGFRISWCLAGGCFAAVFLNRAPSFNDFDADRMLFRTGRVDQFWAELRSWHGSRPFVVAVGPPKLVIPNIRQLIPWTLLGAYNHPALFQTTSAAGYCAATNGAIHFPAHQVPYHWSGFFLPNNVPPIAEEHPDMLLMTLLDIRFPSDDAPPIVLFAASSYQRTRYFCFQHESNLITELPSAPQTEAPK